MQALGRAAWLAAPALFTAGCLSGSSTLATTTTLTMISVDPTAFVGSATCGTRLQKYVVTISDVSHAADGSFPSFSSGPTACTELVSFAGPQAGTAVVVGDYYIGTIDGYDRDDIQPQQPGSRQMVDLSEIPMPVLPRWTTTCGRPPLGAEGGIADASQEDSAGPVNPLLLPVQAKADTDVFLLGCTPFSDPVIQADGGAGTTNDASQGSE